MAVQDDRREEEQIELFALSRPSERSRDGTDAELHIDDRILEFELKSTTKNSVTTVRDFGMNHIKKWEGKHWIFGFYTENGRALKYTRYASPRMMSGWIEEKRNYIELDFQLAGVVSMKLDMKDLFSLVGQKQLYTLEDAKRVYKNQFRLEQYKEFFDMPDGYSQERMLQILHLRCKYVVERGSTLNNPHIPSGVLESFPKITQDHDQQLRVLVRQELKI